MKFELYQKVLVRSGQTEPWRAKFFSHIDGEDYVTTDGSWNTYCIPYSKETKHLANTIDDYVEPYKPKDGDFVTATDCEDATIFIINTENNSNNYYSSYLGLIENRETLCLTGSWSWCSKNRGLRLATKEEKQLLLDALHDKDKDWDAEHKRLVDLKWIPEEHEIYYAPVFSANGKFEISSFVWGNDGIDVDRLEKEWVLKHRNDCQSLCNKLNNAINNVK